MSAKLLHRDSNPAPLFAALADDTRLTMVESLAAGRAQSISQLTSGTELTRQAVTKHLRVLERVGLVQSTRSGREKLFSLAPEPLEEMRQYLDFVTRQWDRALYRLKRFVEE